MHTHVSHHPVIRGCNVNLNGVHSKVQSLSQFVEKHDLQLVCVTESRLTSEILSSFVSIPHFNLLQNDVPGTVHKHGVCAFIHEDLLIDSVSCPVDNVLMFRLLTYNIHVIVVYRPPSYNIQQNDELAHALEGITLGKEGIMLGDFNLPSITWTSADQPPLGSVPPSEARLLEVILSTGWTQWVTEPTFPRSGNTLDLLFTMEPDCIGKIEVLEPLPACDHCPVMFEYVCDGVVDSPVTVLNSCQYVWHKGNYNRLRQELSLIDWDFELSFLNVSEAYDRFATIVFDLTKECVPTKERAVTDKVPWRKTPPCKLIRQRKEKWDAYKLIRAQSGRRSTQAKEAFSQYARLNKEFRVFEVKSQSEYEHGLINRFRENPKFLHAYIRGKKTAQQCIGPLRMPGGDLSSDPKVLNECLASAFSKVYNPNIPAYQEEHQTHEGHIGSVQVTVGEIEARLQFTDENSAMGPDNIHPKVLKMCATQLSYPLHMIFTLSLEDGVIPTAWKKSLVVPIFKKGSRYDPLNYRPVSITSVPCKILEKIIVENMQKYLDSNAILSHHQFGFRQGRSTMEQLLVVYEHVAACVDKGGVIDVILLDYSKAFDVVCHQILLKKLHCIGIDGQLLKWIESFLSDRTMQVCVKGEYSSQRAVLSGVPQGSVLGPLLFLVYINHIGSKLSGNYKIFADDLKLYACVGQGSVAAGSSVGNGSMQDDINVLHDTSVSWGLNLNREKCAVLRFSRNFRDRQPAEYHLNSAPLSVCDSHIDLGVTVDTSLKFHQHISSVAHKSAGLCQSFLKATVCRTPEFMLFFFTTHVRPIIEYASCVWNTGYVEDLRRLERTQRRWTKHVKGLEELPYSERLRQLDLFSVQGRLLRADLIQYWKIFHEKSSICPDSLFTLSTSTGTRGHKLKIQVPRSSTEIRRRSFSHRQIAMWNSLPEHVVAASDLSTFKRLLVETVSDKLYEFV